jgi:hypothetical protein
MQEFGALGAREGSECRCAGRLNTQRIDRNEKVFILTVAGFLDSTL